MLVHGSRLARALWRATIIGIRPQQKLKAEHVLLWLAAECTVGQAIRASGHQGIRAKPWLTEGFLSPVSYSTILVCSVVYIQHP